MQNEYYQNTAPNDFSSNPENNNRITTNPKATNYYNPKATNGVVRDEQY